MEVLCVDNQLMGCLVRDDASGNLTNTESLHSVFGFFEDFREHVTKLIDSMSLLYFTLRLVPTLSAKHLLLLNVLVLEGS